MNKVLFVILLVMFMGCAKPSNYDSDTGMVGNSYYFVSYKAFNDDDTIIHGDNVVIIYGDVTRKKITTSLSDINKMRFYPTDIIIVSMMKFTRKEYENWSNE